MNTAIDIWQIITSPLFVLEIYSVGQEVVRGTNVLPSLNIVQVNRLIAIEQEYYREKLVGNSID